MNIDQLLAGLGDDESIPTGPSSTGFVELDQHFTATDFGLEDAAGDEIVMSLPTGKVAKISRQRMQSCKTAAELKELDRTIYRSVGLDPIDFGL